MVLIRRSFGMLYQFLYKSIFGNFIENIFLKSMSKFPKGKRDNVSCRSSADARRANCAAPERAGADRRRQPRQECCQTPGRGH